jgi:hypothetical protein
LVQKRKIVASAAIYQTSQQINFLAVGGTGLMIIGVIPVTNILLKRKNEANRRELAERELQH